MSPLWWIPLGLAAVATGTASWGARRMLREVAALRASLDALAEVGRSMTEVQSGIADARRAVEQLDLR